MKSHIKKTSGHCPTCKHYGDDCTGKQKEIKIKTPYGTKNWSFIKRLFDSYVEAVEAGRVLIDHAKERYPHFESPRGQADIERLEKALKKLEVEQ